MTLEIVENGHLGGYAKANSEYPNGDPDCYFPGLWQWLIDKLSLKSVLDVGCGEGHAVKWFADHGLDAWGLEGCETAIQNSPVRNRISPVDFTKPYTVPTQPYDLVWSSEFVEHVNEQFIPNFMPVFKLGTWVAMTHAFPGQVGWHHVNCKPAEFWIDTFYRNGFQFEKAITDESRKMADGHWGRSGLIFRKVKDTGIPVEKLYPNVIPYPKYPDDYEYPECNLCGSSPNYRTIVIPQAKGTRMDLVECTQCGFRFFSPRPKWSALKPYLFEHGDMEGEATRYYENASFFKVDDPEHQKAILRSYYGMILGHVKEAYGRIPQSMFEVGGCSGWFAVNARDFGIPLIHGLDLNKYAAAICREKQGFPNIEAGDFLDYQPTRKYELVVALDYLEHTYHPRQDLEKFASMLEPGGLLLTKTFLDEFDYKHEMLAPPVHCAHWTSDVLRHEFEKVGLKVVLWKPDWGGFVYFFICQKA